MDDSSPSGPFPQIPPRQPTAPWPVFSASSTPSPAILAPIEKDAPDAIDLPESAPLADGAIIASVIPALTGVWSDAARRLTDARPLTVGPGLKTGLKMNFSDPTAVGADRVAEMVGAKSTYGAPALVIDLGTSTTFELLDEAGAFRGGIIAPGHEARRPGAGPRSRPAGRRGT